ncbi:SMC-Scp complex subunit ScpB [Corallincola luteus]|uniref:SMC-Scp complex subunit ScpB n=2 Tax=Corallincola TaxID=1775176 RepID=A0A368NL40_9GAMM|nr:MULTISPECIES: SMC-Scp complex subunit ScpB [Corallincola]RCU50495.1 SMC-Scp complex subunit ScpB [Corallincola holothuriorum]TCI01820.1 SMC-Scp complex subunit ScpB [Corallincola luteus]
MRKINDEQLKQLIEAALFVADKPLTAKALLEGVLCEFTVSGKRVKAVIDALVLDYAPRGINLVEVASGWRFQSAEVISPWLGHLWPEKTPRYSRALMETLALIAYRQPITRSEIEAVRGVTVSSNIIRTLSERQWIKVVGHKEVPGRPALYATSRQFLDYFGLKSLEQLPALEENPLSDEPVDAQMLEQVEKTSNPQEVLEA